MPCLLVCLGVCALLVPFKIGIKVREQRNALHPFLVFYLQIMKSVSSDPSILYLCVLLIPFLQFCHCANVDESTMSRRVERHKKIQSPLEIASG